MNHPLSCPEVLGLSSVAGGALMGLDYQGVTVEVACRRGPGSFQLAGLAETAVREARIRLSSALSRLGFLLDEYSLTVNLAPANLKKSGSGLDLPLAVGILAAIGELPVDTPKDALFVGEVALDGSLRPIPGVLPLLEGALRRGVTTAYVPHENSREAALMRGMSVIAVPDLRALVSHLDGREPLPPIAPFVYQPDVAQHPNLADVRGQSAAKRALLVAAAGNHHLLMIGPPGSGKSLMARRLPGLLPPLSFEAALQTSGLHSIAGLLGDRGVVGAPPFRAPHHTVSDVGLVGGGSVPRPGEVSLAHNGVLFLDELPEFRRSALEALRQPLEDEVVHLARARFRTSFPARPLLVAAMNPCPCGNYRNPRVGCRCTEQARLRYLSRVSGPLLDRIDLHVVVPPADLLQRSRAVPLEDAWSSERLRSAVELARARQSERKRKFDLSSWDNARLSLGELERVAQPDTSGARLLDVALEKNQLSARGYVRVLRLARTIADLAGEERPLAEHVGEALRYRVADLAHC